MDIADLAPSLSALEIALLLSLVSQEHCLIETTDDAVHDVANELALISSNTFNLTFTVLDCDSDTSLDSFCEDIQYTVRKPSWISPPQPDSRNALSQVQASQGIDRISKKDVASVVIAKNFNHASDDVQLHALQLIISKTLTVHSVTLDAPQYFLFVPLVIRSSDQLRPRLNAHLNDHISISHFHDFKDGYTYLEEGGGWLSDGQLSGSSVIRRSDRPMQYSKISTRMLEDFQDASKSVSINSDVTRYVQDIVIFLRLNRGVAGGITSNANRHFRQFTRLLAVLHGLDYVVPSIVCLAARKVFRHRIIVARPEDDRSLQYGSDLKAVSAVLADVTPDSILDDVLDLEAPL